MKNINDQTIKFAQMGRAALLPGMVHMLDLMQQQIEEFRRELEGAQAQPRRVEGATRLGRPRKQVEAIEGRASSGWPADPEARSAEMKRRMAVAKAKLKPQHPDSEQHEAWLTKLRADRKAAWAKLSPRKQQERVAKMLAGRKAKRQPVVKLAVAS
jgi:hypothetical protein